MTNKEVIRDALQYYIIANGETKYDAERKVEEARHCLDELEATDNVERNWIEKKSLILNRVTRVYNGHLSRIINESMPCEDVSKDREARRKLSGIMQVVKEFMDSVGIVEDLPI